MDFKIETERLVLRNFRTEDGDDVMKFWGDPEVMEYCYGGSNREHIESAIVFYGRCQEKKGFSVYAVTIKETGEVIGACGFNPTKDESEIELIYHYKKVAWGRGYATEAGKACIKYAEDNCKNINLITASVDPRHEASMKILEKVGFKHTHSEYCDKTNLNEPYYEIVLNR